MARPDLPELLADRIAASAEGPTPIVAGLTGPQGSGKSTLAAALLPLLGARGLRAAVLALDDLYLPRADRLRLASQVHPLLATRGVPGTHDVALGLAAIESLRQGLPTRLPSFDKATDDRRPPAAWATVAEPVEVILFEGWCVGARPQAEADLATPVNDLERERDPDGTWRRHSNRALAGDYQRLFGHVDLQMLMLPPSFDVVLAWRLQQEHDLRARTGLGQTDAEIAVFIQHYERLTRHIAAEMPHRADVVVRLGEGREVLGLSNATPPTQKPAHRGEHRDPGRN